MCHVPAGRQVPEMNTLCDCGSSCGCGCPVTLTIDDEISRLEEHKKILKDRIDNIDQKIAGLKTVNEP
jgi:hypothetical protein